MENKKLYLASLAGASILLKQLLEQELLTHDEAEAIMRKTIRDNGFLETSQSFLIHPMHGKEYYLRSVTGNKVKG